MHNVLDEKCGLCYFWIHSDLPEVRNGTCCRFPRKEQKNYDEGCGEFKDRKVMQILREAKKHEANP